jgi:hypothetical protein
MLKLALQGSLRRSGHDAIGARELAQKGLNAIGAANLHLLDQLAAAAQPSLHPGAATLVAAAHRQALIIQAVLGA